MSVKSGQTISGIILTQHPATKGMSYVEKHHPAELNAYLEAKTPKKAAKRSLF